MKYFLLMTLIIPLNLWSIEAYLILADIGFSNSDEYIGIELSAGAEIEYKFSLCKTSTGVCLKLNDCQYKEASLVENLSISKNEKFKKEFEWIFLMSGKSELDFNEFYPEFSKLLKRTLPNCAVPELKSKTEAT